MKLRTTVILILSLEVLVGLLGLINYDNTLDGLQATTRFSGRLSLAIFTLIFLMQGGWDNRLRAILSENYFLIFAIAHGIHLIELISFVYVSGTPVIPYRVVGGFLAYAFIFAMPYLSNRFQTGRLTQQRFERTANVYLYYVLFIFFMTYFSRVQGKVPNAGGTHAEHVMGMIWVLSLAVLRIIRQVFYKVKRQTT
jgi:hypothetical protein